MILRAGGHPDMRLIADGETVVDVPAKLAARARVFDTGNGHKTDPADAHSVAVLLRCGVNLTTSYIRLRWHARRWSLDRLPSSTMPPLAVELPDG
jgi:hypothetical protein